MAFARGKNQALALYFSLVLKITYKYTFVLEHSSIRQSNTKATR